MCDEFVCKYRIYMTCLYYDKDLKHCEENCKMRKVQPCFGCVHADKCKKKEK